MKYNSQRGYSLVETLIAVSILLTALVGPLTIVYKSLQTGYDARSQTTAVFLAQEGVEIFFQIHLGRTIEGLQPSPTYPYRAGWNWVSYNSSTPSASAYHCFVASESDSGCNIDLESGVNVSCANPETCRMVFDENGSRAKYQVDTGSNGEDTEFIREIKILQDDTDYLRIISTVSWESELHGDTRSISVESAMYNIYNL